LNFPGYTADQIKGYRIAPLKERADRTRPSWREAFIGLKHARLKNIRDANLRNVLNSLGAVSTAVTLHNEADFKAGSVSPKLYDLFFPKYWALKGGDSVMNFMWS
jgi:hypothetical protein